MAKIAVSLVVAALALHASALYHFKQKTLGVCDQKVLIVTTTPDPNEHMQLKLSTHGLLVRQTVETCTAGSCQLSVEQLYRPDLAGYLHLAKEFAWSPATDRLGDPAQCMTIQVDDGEVPDMYTPVEGEFENREIALFRGIKCFKYSDPDSDDALFGDDATGALYGMQIDDTVYAYNITPAKHTPATFTFNSTGMPECEPDSFKEPLREAYEKQCENLPTHRPVSAIFQSRFIRALSHKLRAHKHL